MRFCAIFVYGREVATFFFDKISCIEKSHMKCALKGFLSKTILSTKDHKQIN